MADPADQRIVAAQAAAAEGAAAAASKGSDGGGERKQESKSALQQLHPDAWCALTISGNAFLYHQVSLSVAWWFQDLNRRLACSPLRCRSAA